MKVFGQMCCFLFSRWIRYICDKPGPAVSSFQLLVQKHLRAKVKVDRNSVAIRCRKQNMFGDIWRGIDPNEEPPNLLKDVFPVFLGGRKPMDKDLYRGNPNV